MVVWYALIVNEASFGKCLRGLAARRFVPGRPWFIWLARTMVLSIIEWAHPSCMMLLWPRPSPIPSLHGRERSLARAPNRTRRIWVFYFLSTKKILLWAGRWWWSDLRLLNTSSQRTRVVFPYNCTSLLDLCVQDGPEPTVAISVQGP